MVALWGAGRHCLLCLCAVPDPMHQGTYRGHPKGVIVSHDDNGGEVFTSQPRQPSLRRDSDGPRMPKTAWLWFLRVTLLRCEL